MNDRFTR